MKIKSVKFLRKPSFLGGPHTVIMYCSLFSASGVVNLRGKRYSKSRASIKVIFPPFRSYTKKKLLCETRKTKVLTVKVGEF